ncbi:MAG: general secretion pathway protein GspK [Planctomycetes bacterium]|nr:general secretion pathway protein GspK [Planctomycetota bacterium]
MKNNLTQRQYKRLNARTGNRGVALMLTLVVLIILTAIVYPLTSRLAMVRHRQQYTIDYQKARYARDSAMKYILTRVKTIKFDLANRLNDPDFSDLFTLDKGEYQQLLEEWTEVKALQALEKFEQEQLEEARLEAEHVGPFARKPKEKERGKDSLDNFMDFFENINYSDPNYFDESGELILDPNMIIIPGPYGPEWPYVIEPIEFEIGQAKITITIEDENAKMPLTWAITSDKNVGRLATDALRTFCEWMQMDSFQMDDLYGQLEDIAEHKKFSIVLRPITSKQTVSVKPPVSKTTASRSRVIRRPTTSTIVRQTRPAIAHTADFARLLHSSMLDLEELARPVPATGDRRESALKYLALWGSQKVNINTAPRHVLEAAFTFGGYPTQIADEVIRRRKEKPFKTVSDLTSEIYGYSDAIRKATPYLTTTSTFFSIRVTVSCGSSKTSSVATIVKKDKDIQRIAMITGR